jgi:hypothetical protein
MFRSRTLKAGLSSLVLMGTVLVLSSPTEAGWRTGTWRNGMVAGPYGPGYYGGYRPAFGGYHGGYRPAFGSYYGGYRPFYGGYRPAYYGYGYRPYYRRHNYGGAVAAGLIGGLALGALARAPYGYSYPGYSYPVYGGNYYGTSVYDEPSCYTVRRRYVDDWGRLVSVRTQVCE